MSRLHKNKIEETPDLPQPREAEELIRAKAEAANDIDLAAGSARERLVSPGALTDQEYIMAYEDAKAFEAAGFSGPVPDGVQSWADNNSYDFDARAAAENIISTRNLWYQVAMEIRAIRLAGKQAVANAGTVANVEKVRDVAIAQLKQI